MERTTVFIGPQDRAAIETIRARYGVASDSDAMRLSLRVLAASPMLILELPERPKHARRSPKPPTP